MTSPAPPPFPWEAVLAFGFGRLRLSSRDFWATTPLELAAAASGGRAGAGAISRAGLDALMRAFPD